VRRDRNIFPLSQSGLSGGNGSLAKHVESQHGNRSVLQRRDQRRFVDDGAASDVIRYAALQSPRARRIDQ